MRATGRPPSVVAIGGGHGTAVTLKAARRYAGVLTGVVSVADDGGSSGRLRELLNVVALGDIRKCLVALADEDSALAGAFERRFDEGELAGHALGNLILAGLIDATGDLVLGVAEAAQPARGPRGRAARHLASWSCSRPSRPTAPWPGRWPSWGPADIQRGLAGARGRPAAAPGGRADRRGGPGRDRPRVAVHQRAGRRGGGRHRRGGGLLQAPGGLRVQPASARSPRPRATTWRPMWPPWPGTMSRLTWSLCDSIRGMGIGTTDVRGARRPPDRGEHPGPQPGQTGAGAVRSAGIARCRQREERDRR